MRECETKTIKISNYSFLSWSRLSFSLLSSSLSEWVCVFCSPYLSFFFILSMVGLLARVHSFASYQFITLKCNVINPNVAIFPYICVYMFKLGISHVLSDYFCTILSRSLFAFFSSSSSIFIIINTSFHAAVLSTIVCVISSVCVREFFPLFDHCCWLVFFCSLTYGFSVNVYCFIGKKNNNNNKINSSHSHSKRTSE